MTNNETREKEIIARMEKLDELLNSNPFNSSANSEWIYLNRILQELQKNSSVA